MPVACVCMCLPDTLSRASLFLGLVSLATLAASIATDHWLYTAETLQLPIPNATAKVTIRFRSGLWRACPAPLPANLSGTYKGATPMTCTKIQYFKPDFQLDSWTDLALTPFLKRMRLCTPFLLTSLAFLAVGVVVSLVGHVYADNRTFVAAVLFILAGLILATAIILYITMIGEETLTAKQRERLYYRYGWSFLGAGISFLTGEMAALAGISAYLRRFPTADDIVRLIPGMHRRMRERSDSDSKKSTTGPVAEPLPCIHKRDMTVQTFDSIAVPV